MTTTAEILGTNPSLETLLNYLGTSREELLEFENLKSLDGQKGVSLVLAGSLSEGLGNVRSDVDLLVFGEPPEGFGLESAGSAISGECADSLHFIGKRKVDIAVVPISLIEDAAQRMRQRDGTESDKVHEAWVTSQQLVAVHRMRVGKPVLNADYHRQLVDSFPYDALVRFLQEVGIRRIDSKLDDLYGMIEDEELDTALLVSHDLLTVVYSTYTFYLGETNTTPKWALRFLKRHTEDRNAVYLAERYWQFFHPDVAGLRGDRRAAFDHLRSVIELANQVVEWMQT